MGDRPLNLVVLVSGSGSTLQNLIDRISLGQLHARISLVIGSRDGLPAQQRAGSAQTPYEVVRRKDFDSVEAFSRRVFELCLLSDAELVVCAGWLALLHISPRWEGRVINVHPSLLPEFGGKGMFGRHVHEAVLASGRRVSGCTVHVVDNEYDHGPVLLQRTVEVRPDDTPESLAARVQEQERVALPEAIEMMRLRLRAG